MKSIVRVMLLGVVMAGGGLLLGCGSSVPETGETVQDAPPQAPGAMSSDSYYQEQGKTSQ